MDKSKSGFILSYVLIILVLFSCLVSCCLIYSDISGKATSKLISSYQNDRDLQEELYWDYINNMEGQPIPKEIEINDYTISKSFYDHSQTFIIYQFNEFVLIRKDNHE